MKLPNNKNYLSANFLRHVAFTLFIVGITACAPNLISQVQSSLSLSEGATASSTPVSSCGPGKLFFSYTGTTQTFTLPSNCSSSSQVFMKMWGAGGGGAPFTPGGGVSTNFYPGGGSGYVSASITLDPSLTYTVLVGGAGHGAMSNQGGFGGGGNGDANYYSSGGGGGGRSALQNSSIELLTAGGGGGGGYSNYGNNRSGGAAGGIAGLSGGGGDGVSGGGGNQSGGGSRGFGNTTNGSNGIQFLGATAVNTYAGGGGGGYYGGGSGSDNNGDNGGGGGGSSFVGGSGVSTATSTAGAGSAQANSIDPDNAGAGAGGGSASNGTDGLVVIYYGAAQIASITSPSPAPGHSASGSVTGGTVVTIQGLGFVPGTTVFIGSSNCANLTIASINQLTCSTPSSGSLGAADIVLNAPGAQTATLNSGFYYTP